MTASKQFIFSMTTGRSGSHYLAEVLRLNLPDTQVPDLVIEGSDLVIATHGRSFYILDNINPLRQITPAIVSSDQHLFKPPVAQRGVTQGRISYYLKQPVRTGILLGYSRLREQQIREGVRRLGKSLPA